MAECSLHTKAVWLSYVCPTLHWHILLNIKSQRLQRCCQPQPLLIS